MKKRGFSVDAHVFGLVLDANRFDSAAFVDSVEQATKSGIQFVTLADLPGEDAESKLYELCVETSKDNPGQYSSLPLFAEWRKEFFPEACSRKEWVFLAVDGDRFVGVTQIFSTKEAGVIYTTIQACKKNIEDAELQKS